MASTMQHAAVAVTSTDTLSCESRRVVDEQEETVRARQTVEGPVADTVAAIRRGTRDTVRSREVAIESESAVRNTDSRDDCEIRERVRLIE